MDSSRPAVPEEPICIAITTGSAEDKECLAALRQCCSLYQGNHPFHNYTKRRLYRIPTADAMSGELHL